MIIGIIVEYSSAMIARINVREWFSIVSDLSRVELVRQRRTLCTFAKEGRGIDSKDE